MELVLASFWEKIYLRIQPSCDDGGWWLTHSKDIDYINESVWSSLEDFILESGQTRVIPLEVLARELMVDW